MRKVFLILAMLSVCNLTQANEIGEGTGSYLLEHFRHYSNYIDSGDVKHIKQNPYSISYCQGFVDSTRQTVAQMQVFIDNDEYKTCIPQNSRNDQIAKIIVNYLKNRPDILHKGAGLVALMSLMEAFPCSNK